MRALYNLFKSKKKEKINFFDMIEDNNFGKIKEVLELSDEDSYHINQVNKEGRTPLSVAARKGYSNIVAQLLDHKALINHKDHNQLTPLAHACINGSKKCVELLLSKGANTEIPNRNNHTPIYLAFLNNNFSIVALFLNKGLKADLVIKKVKLMAKIDQIAPKDKERCVALLKYSIENNNIKIFALFEKYASKILRMDNHIGFHPLMFAVKHGRDKIVKQLIEQKIDINQVDSRGHTALKLAIKYDKHNVVKLLLDNKAKIEFTLKKPNDNHDLKSAYTPLGIASFYNSIKSMKVLLDYNADINSNNFVYSKSFNVGISLVNVISPLMIACVVGNVEAVDILLKRKANTEYKNSNGLTVLAYTVYTSPKHDKLSDIVQKLVDGGAKIDTKGRRGNLLIEDLKHYSCGLRKDFQISDDIFKILEKNDSLTKEAGDNRVVPQQQQRKFGLEQKITDEDEDPQLSRTNFNT